MLRLILLFAFALTSSLLRPPAAEACGYSPWSEDSDTPDSALLKLLEGRRLPLLSPSWHSEYWVIAWARLQGKRFSRDELASLNGPWLQSSAALEPALAAWRSARAQVSGVGAVNVEAHRAGENYAYVLFCGADGFRTAAETLSARLQTQSAEETRRWLDAQDRVFATCSNAHALEPDAALPGASAVEQMDRAYQRAVWAEYAAHPEAVARYDAIAASASPWADIARYRSLRLRLKSSPPASVLPAFSEAMRHTQDAKALRALRQLQDRYGLFPQGPAEAMRVLSTRLLAEDLGADLPRTLRDIVYFAKRMDACSTALSSVIACRTPSSDHFLATLRRAPEDVRWAESSRANSALLGLNAAFYQGRASLAAGRSRAALRSARRALSLAAHSTHASRNAAHALIVASGGQAQDHLLRRSMREEAYGELHADGRGWLAGGTIREWEELARRSPELRENVAAHVLVRSALLGTWGRARRYARQLSAGDSALAQSLQTALAAPASERRARLLLAIVHHDITELSITTAFGSHYGTTQVAGCDLGGCMDAHPYQTAYAPSFVRAPSAERRRLAERRIDDLGEAVMAEVTRHPDSPLNEELLHRFVRLTRRASIHGQTSERTGELSHAAFDHLHARYEDGPWTQRTRHWFR